MELSPEARKRAVTAFKQELILGLAIMRDNLAKSPLDWKGKEHKMLLHRLKGGGSFLGYTQLSQGMAELEGIAQTYPTNPQKWIDLFNLWEAEIADLS